MEILTTGSSDYGRYVKALICGDPGSGKTLISSTFPNPFFANVEGGMLSIWDRGIKHVKVESSSDLKEVLVLAQQSADVRKKTVGAPMDTVVVDTIDEVARVLVKERLNEIKKEALGIADWGWLGDQLRGIIRAFRNLDDMHVVFTCHLKSTEDSETGRMFLKPAIQGAVGDEVAGYVDLALLLRAQTVVRPVDGESKRMVVRYIQTFPDQNHPCMYATIFDEANLLGAAVEGSVKIVDEILHSERTEAVANESQIESPNIETSVSPVALKPEDYESQPEAPAEVPETRVSQSDIPIPNVPAEAPKAETSVESQATARSQLATMTAKDKMRLEVPAECEECGTVVTNQDQKDMSVVKYRLVLCNRCFKAAKKER
jgi:hypothetical protein